jgi:hypothetical protein
VGKVRGRKLQCSAGTAHLLALVCFTASLVLQPPIALGESTPRVELVERNSGEAVAEQSGFDERAFSSSARPVPFGRAVALIPLDLHEPGLPYAFEILSPDGRRQTIERPGRTILEVRRLESHLLVASRGEETVGELFDENGLARWTFRAPGDLPPRVAILGERAAAVYPGRSASVVEIQDGATGGARSWTLEGAVLTQVALSTEGGGLLAWGPREAAWIDEERGGVVWRTRMPATDRPLASTTSTVTPVGGAILLVTREAAADGAWAVNVVFFDLDDGRIAGRRILHRSEEMPSAVARRPRGASERLVLQRHVYEVRGAEGAEP